MASQKITPEVLLEFKNQIKAAILTKKGHDEKKIPQINVAANIVICDRLNAQPSLAWRAERTIRKIALGKNDADAILALNLADMTVKNCPRFRPTMNTKVFSKGLMKCLPKDVRDPQGVSFQSMMDDDSNSSKTERVMKSLLLIKSWSKIGDQWKKVYDTLLQANCEFPEPAKDEVSPLDFDDKKIPAKNDFVPSTKTGEGKKVFFTDGECRKAAALFEVLNDMLRAKPENPAKDPMIQELKGQCERLQSSVHGRVASVSSPQILSELLKVNDLFNELTQLYKDVLAGKDIAPPPLRSPVHAKVKEDVKTAKIQDTKSKKAEKKIEKENTQNPTPKNNQPDLLNLFDPSTSEPGGTAVEGNVVQQPQRQGTFDLLNSVFGNEGANGQGPVQGTVQGTVTNTTTNVPDTLDLLSDLNSANAAPQPEKQNSAFADDPFMALARKRRDDV
eukprot:CAMPEP_0114496002 /NCGR_PEP_ID=MMETSP0109-20121206/5533_1 /TAXON_ID=29199 /ORGANISM="Chlorarachnion reptans, Strain CCCM449" /LENGTH=446 /DNA_ID=CAMNT_0001673237 /DNA_START=138 /DNA_END=1478 /DNA_ORIENTATION=-